MNYKPSSPPVKKPTPLPAAAQYLERIRLKQVFDRWLIGDIRLSPEAYRPAVTALAKSYPTVTALWQNHQTHAPVKAYVSPTARKAYDTCILKIANRRVPPEVRAAVVKLARLIGK